MVLAGQVSFFTKHRFHLTVADGAAGRIPVAHSSHVNARLPARNRHGEKSGRDAYDAHGERGHREFDSSVFDGNGGGHDLDMVGLV